MAITDPLLDDGHGLVAGNPVDLSAITEPKTDRTGFDIAVAGQQHERHPLVGVVDDLLGHPVIAGVHVDSDPVRFELGCNVFQVRNVAVGNGNADHLHRRQPGRESAGVVLGEDAEEPLDRPEQRSVDQHRALARTVGGGVFQLEAIRHVEIDLQRGHLPTAAQGVLDLH